MQLKSRTSWAREQAGEFAHSELAMRTESDIREKAGGA